MSSVSTTPEGSRVRVSAATPLTPQSWRPSWMSPRASSDASAAMRLAVVCSHFWRTPGVDIEDVVVDPLRPTGIYVNRRGEDGVHRFDYHRSGSAGCAIEPADVALVPTEGVAFTHYTGIGLSVSATSAQACFELVRRTRATGGRFSFSANIRPRLDPDLAVLREAAAAADVVFLSSEDAALLYGHVDAAVAELAATAAELVVTNGGRGAALYTRGERVTVRPPTIDVVDAAGAGDAVAGAYLAARARDVDEASALEQGVVAGALSRRAFGCAASYPKRSDVLVSLQTSGGRSR